MRQLRFRCSSIGKIMTDPKTKKEGILSVGAKTYIRELVMEEILGIEFEISGKELEKGIEVEGDSIALLNRVRGLSLVKNTERRTTEYLTGECDLYDAQRRRGHDLKSSWSAKTFLGWPIDCADKLYEWQMRGYMHLWDADEWEVNYCLVDTPERLVRYDPFTMHMVSHIPEHIRLTSLVIERDLEKEESMIERVKAARDYATQMVIEFDHAHRTPVLEAA